MAVIEKHFLDLPGLQQYDTLLKALIPQADDITITIDSETGKLTLVHVPEVNTQTETLILS